MNLLNLYDALHCTMIYFTSLHLYARACNVLPNRYSKVRLVFLFTPFIPFHTIPRAHDRALIRAIGPSNCRTINLNFPVSEYSCEPLSRFMEFDEKLKGQLFATAWTGLKHCDFGFLLIRGAQNQGHASLHMQHQVQKLALLSSALETGTGTGTDASSASSHTQATHSRTNAKVAATVKGGLRVRSGSSTSASAGSSSAAAAPSSSSSSSSSSSNDAIMATAPPSFAFTSVSLKSKIVKEADVQRNKVAPPVFGTLLSVSNVPSINPISQVSFFSSDFDFCSTSCSILCDFQFF